MYPNLLPKDGNVSFYPQVFSPEESAHLMTRLEGQVAWKHEPIVLFGRQMMQPRLTAWFGPGAYTYSGITMEAQPWTEELLAIKKRVEELANARFNSALLNFYRDQKDSMGWHRDNERELGPEPLIASVSFGATRTFKLRHYTEKNLQLAIDLTPGSCLIMSGPTQQKWEHSIPKRTRPLEARINITFRILLET